MWPRKRPHPAADGGRRPSRLPLLGAVLALSFLAVFWDELSAPLLYDPLHENGGYSVGHRILASTSDSDAEGEAEHKLYIPPSLDDEQRQRLLAKSGFLSDSGESNGKRLLKYRTDPGNSDPESDASKQERNLSLNLGNGNCKWQPLSYTVPEEIDFHKTIVVGYPSGDKRMVYLQMEALVGWPCKDEWDFAYGGMSNHPFIKGNYSHHEGIWGWGNPADQVVMIVPNIRRSMVEYHDILWDLGYATTWEAASQHSGNLYNQQPTLEEYHEWRDSRVMDEACWYGTV